MGDADDDGTDDTGGETDEIPIDDMYDEPTDIPVNPVDLLYQKQEEQWESVEFAEITVEGAIRDALADAATQFHYIYLSQLVVLGDIITNVANLDVKRLASFLTASRIRDVDAWGRYLAELEMRTSVADPVHAYCNHLYNDDNRLSRLMGIILADVFRQAVGTNTVDFPDPTFDRLMERDMREGDRNVTLTRRHLQRINRKLDTAEREQVAMAMDRYAALIDDILDDREQSFEQLGISIAHIRSDISDQIDAFHDTVKEG